MHLIDQHPPLHMNSFLALLSFIKAPVSLAGVELIKYPAQVLVKLVSEMSS